MTPPVDGAFYARRARQPAAMTLVRNGRVAYFIEPAGKDDKILETLRQKAVTIMQARQVRGQGRGRR